jgi:hypothetical protein
MLTNMTFRLGVAALVAAASGVGVAYAAAGDDPVLQQVTFPSREEHTALLGHIDQDTQTYPVHGTVRWGDNTATAPQRIMCPANRTQSCELYGTHEFPKVASGSVQTYTATNFVVLTTPTGPILRTSTGTITVQGSPEPSSKQDPLLAFGDVAVGTTSAVVRYRLDNGAHADRDLDVDTPASGDFTVVGNDCTSVAPGDSCSIDVVARPRAEGAREGRVQVLIDDVAEGAIELRAHGTPAPPAATVTTPAVTVTGPTVTLPPRPVAVPPAARCVVPALKGRTLAGARRALTAAKCALGKVTRPSRGSSLVVASQTAKAGTRRTAGTKVGVRLAPRATTRARR